MDGFEDDAGAMIEVSFVNDSEFLRAGLQHGVALPWQIAAYTYGNTLYVVAGVPQTIVRTYFRGVDNYEQLMNIASQYQNKIENIVASALVPLGFTTNINSAIENSQLGETEIVAIEAMLGEKLSAEFVAPSITISDESVDVDTIVTAIANAFLADEVPDLNENGEAGEAGDDAVLPNAIMDYIAGDMTFEQLSGMLQAGEAIWRQGGLFRIGNC